MSMKNLAREVESIALALSEENGYEYYHIDDELRKLAKDVSDMQADNAKLRELVTRMASALGIYSEWVDANWCKSSCRLEFECLPEDMDIRCPAWAAMRELGVGVDE